MIDEIRLPKRSYSPIDQFVRLINAHASSAAELSHEVDEDVERSTRSVPGAYMWVTDETGERKKKCVGVQKIYRSEKDRTLLKQKLAMKTPDFYWRNLDEM